MKNDYAYYFEPKKMIRDLAHGYVNLTEFELRITDTESFQRLKDIRQLTCQEVYPSARHTRFEHSLGVLELTKQAIKHLNQNRFLPQNAEATTVDIIDNQLQLNAAIAALLHDVGHCMFSHLGEKEFNGEEITQALIEEIERFRQDHPGSISDSFFDFLTDTKLKGIGSKHEKLSCLIILCKFEDLLLERDVDESKHDKKVSDVKIDFELLIRCILGIRYTRENGVISDSAEANKHNVVIHLINDGIFDMDKLDYIMRDTVFTGINVGRIDTKRLFKNIFFEDDKSYSLVFSSRAVPALQNYIDARDALYMYVYNHHAAVLADSLNSYIIRRLARNADRFLHLVDLAFEDASSKRHNPSSVKEVVWDRDYIYALGIVPRNYIFSIGSIVDENRSDSDWISLVNTIYTRYANSSEDLVEGYLLGLMEDCYFDGLSTVYPGKKYNKNYAKTVCANIVGSEGGQRLIKKLMLTYKIISDYKKRKFLKPWWKTLSQFSIFLERNYKDVSFSGYSHEDIRSKICRMITYGTKDVPADQLRAQIAKLVVFICNEIHQNPENGNTKILESLQEGDFFISERSTRFNEIENIRKLKIVFGLTELEKSQSGEMDYTTKSLDDVIPQKDYKSIYNKESFYVYSRPLNSEIYSVERKRQHYQCIEEIFVYSTIKFLELTETQTNRYFGEHADREGKNAFFSKCAKDFLGAVSEEIS